MTASDLLEFLRRELAPTPGRGSKTFRLTLACLAATIPILTHHIPHGLVVMIVMYLITQEDTAATVLGSILAVIGVTLGLGLALLAWRISLDIVWLRLCFLVAFLFGGLFLKRVLTIGALGSAIGIPSALVMILPDILPPIPEIMVEFVLWIWWCVTLGLSVNAGVQLLLSPGDPLMLLQHELVTRIKAVEQSLRRLAGSEALEPSSASLSSLSIAGMSRPLALLKTASVVHAWAGERHDGLATLITLVDRLVTSAVALEDLAAHSAEPIRHERLLSVAEGCDRMRLAFEKMRLPTPEEWVALADEKNTEPSIPLLDIERTLDQIALTLPQYFAELGHSKAAPAEKRRLFLPDAFDNPEYVRFAIKGTLAALICYVAFVGFDYPGIYTSVITCFVVSLSTIGASNQKGILRFGGAAVGGLMGLIALVYLFPNIETIGGFWLVFGAGTAVAAWVNFGSPRISYGGYQVGLAFYKAILQDFGPATSATVVRDRLIGIFFGLIVFGIVENLLWPVRAQDALRARLAEVLRLLGELARSKTRADENPRMLVNDVDSWRRRISEKVAGVQGLIESSKFESGSLKVGEIQKCTGHAQLVFVLLLSLARSRDIAQPSAFRTAEVELDSNIATALDALAMRVIDGSELAVPQLDDPLNAFERTIVGTDARDEAVAHFIGRVALYRTLVAVITRLSLESPNTGLDGQGSRSSNVEMFLESRETKSIESSC
jgi:multidrug resistance protein MdtO